MIIIGIQMIIVILLGVWISIIGLDLVTFGNVIYIEMQTTMING